MVNVSSMVHQGARIDFDDLDRAHGFDGYAAYGTSKLMNVLVTYELARRLEGRGVTVNAMHPGVIGTKLLRKGFGSTGGADLEEGGVAEVKLAIDPQLAGVDRPLLRPDRGVTLVAGVARCELQRRVYEMSLSARASRRRSRPARS